MRAFSPPAWLGCAAILKDGLGAAPGETGAVELGGAARLKDGLGAAAGETGAGELGCAVARLKDGLEGYPGGSSAEG